jgi:hypothetical protein
VRSEQPVHDLSLPPAVPLGSHAGPRPLNLGATVSVGGPHRRVADAASLCANALSVRRAAGYADRASRIKEEGPARRHCGRLRHPLIE